LTCGWPSARDLRARGLSVIPVPPPRPGVPAGHPGDGKVPAIAWREYQSRLASDSEIAAWFKTEQNIAIVTGAISGVVAVDADTPDACRWVTRHPPYSAWQTKTPRGYHLFYRHPGRPVPNRARIDTRDDGRLALDVRGDGGFVIAPGSRHASGATYVQAGDWSVPRERLPVFWEGWIARPQRPARQVPPTRPSGNLTERARRYLASVPRPEIGQGSDSATLYAACRLVRGFGLSASEAECLLWEWAGNRDGWTQEWLQRKAAHAERHGTEPIGALR
jgi:hypothetical protein